MEIKKEDPCFKAQSREGWQKSLGPKMSRPFVNDTGITFEKAMECKTFKKSNFTFEAQLGRNEAYNIVSLTQNHSS